MVQTLTPTHHAVPLTCCAPCSHAAAPRTACRRTQAACRAAPSREVRVCTNTVCKKMGSQQVLRFAQDLGLVGVDVLECGCLGG